MENDLSNPMNDGASTEAFERMIGGNFNPEFFHYLHKIYRSRTGYHLILSDVNGSIQMGLPDCDKFPCMHSCRECREQIVSEALRTGKVCVDACHEGYVIWGLPVEHEGRIVGGLIVFGGSMKDQVQSGEFEEACEELYTLMVEYDLLPQGYATGERKSKNIHRYVYRKAFEELEAEVESHAKPLIDGLQMAEFSEAQNHFLAIKQAFARQRGLPLDLLRGLILNLVFRAQSQFVSSGSDSYACVSEAGFLTELLSKARTAEQLEIGLDQFFERFQVLSRQRPKDADDQMVERATTYLEEHLREDLTRDRVARAVGISPSHFSRLIREKKGRTFTDLLNQYRVEHASKLMIRSSKTLAEISSEAGFCDQSYFSKVFRRYKGLSPAKYKSANQL